MRVTTALVLALAASLAACGDADDTPANTAGAAFPDATGSDAEVAADAALADDAARAEAEDAAIGGNVTAEDVSAAANVTMNVR